VDEAQRLFSGLDQLRVQPVATFYDRSMMGPAARIAPTRLGWQLVITGRKPADGAG
jgi:hypothetical protein